MPVKYLKSSVLVEIKMAARAASLTSITNFSGGTPSSVDGVALAIGDRVFVNTQANAKDNGIYQVSIVGTAGNGTWIRASDFDENADVKAGALVVVTEGTTQADTVWELSTNNPIIIGTTPINFVLVGGTGVITGAGTTPFMAYFSTATQISSTSLAQVGANDIIFNGGVALKTSSKSANYNVTVDDVYIGGGLRLVPITFTLPPVVTVQDGHFFIFKDESEQSPGLPVIAATQMGEVIDTSTISISTIVPGESFSIIKRDGVYRLIP